MHPFFKLVQFLINIDWVDYIIIFNDDTPLHLIQQLLPDILTKGADYDINNIVGASVVIDNGGEVKTIELTEGHSTTKIITYLLHN